MSLREHIKAAEKHAVSVVEEEERVAGKRGSEGACIERGRAAAFSEVLAWMESEEDTEDDEKQEWTGLLALVLIVLPVCFTICFVAWMVWG